MSNIKISTTNLSTVVISGEGNIDWSTTVTYKDVAKHIVIKGTIRCLNMSNLFANFKLLEDIEGTIDTSLCSDFSYAYANCHKLIKPVQDLDTSNGEEFDFMHSNNKLLESVKFNSTLQGIKFNNMFYNCASLKSIRGVNISNTVEPSNTEGILYGCNSLT